MTHETPQPPIEELLRHVRWIEDLARRLVRDPAVADDLAQAAWVAALRDPERPQSDPRGWMARVVRNLARERHRRESQRASVERRGARAESLPSPHELLEKAEAERVLVESVLQLGEPHRTTLLLRYFEGLRPEEIARREGVPLATVTHRITRAHARLREHLSARESGDESRTAWLSALAPILPRTGGGSSWGGAFEHPSSASGWGARELLMKIVPVLLAGCVLVALGLFVWSRERKDASRPAPVASATSTTAEPHSALAAAPSLDESDRASVATAPAVEPSPSAPAAAKAPSDPPKTSRIHGRVFRPDGAPASKRRVRFLDMQPLHGKGSGENYVFCNEAGEFDAHDIEGGIWSVSTWPDKAELAAIGIPYEGTLNGMAYLAERTIELGDGQAIPLELGAPPLRPIHVRGRVLRGDQPEHIAAVQWLPAGEGTYDLKKNARTLNELEYETTLDKPGRYYVTAILDAARPTWTIDVPDERELAQDLVLEANVVEGRIVDRSGSPVRGVSVELGVHGGRRAPLLLATLGLSQTTDAQGRFRFACLPDGEYVVHAQGGKLGDGGVVGAATASKPVRAGPAPNTPLELIVEPGVSVSVRVVDAEGRERHASVFVFDSSGEPLAPLTGTVRGKEGEHQLIPLAPGRYAAVAAAGTRWSAVGEFEVPAQGLAAPVELVLEAAATLTIDARSVPHTLVQVTDDAGRRFGGLIDRARFNRAVERDWDEDVPLLRLPRGNYDVLAVGPAGVLARTHVALVPGEPARVRLAP